MPTSVINFGDYSYQARSRWGHGQPAHPQLERLLSERASTYVPLLQGMQSQLERFAAISVAEPADRTQPFWSNSWFSGLDAASLYTLLVAGRPKLYLEVGSGNSTKFARRAIRDAGLPTSIVSIDPEPRAEIDSLCDRRIAARLEDAPLELFDLLQPGDVLFIDNSHRCLPNSDVTVCFLDVLPRLKRGVIVGLHDIFLPADYPPGWEARAYSEQYLLATALLAGAPWEVLLPAYFVATSSRFTAEVERVFAHPTLAQVPRLGGAFWFST